MTIDEFVEFTWGIAQVTLSIGFWILALVATIALLIGLLLLLTKN